MGSKYDGPVELKHGDLKSLVDFNVQMAFIEYDSDQDGFLNFDEWRRYASEDTDVKEFLASWHTAMDVLKCPWGDLADANSGGAGGGGGGGGGGGDNGGDGGGEEGVGGGGSDGGESGVGGRGSSAEAGADDGEDKAV